MKVMVLGAGGMLGHKIVQRLSDKFEIIGTVRELLLDKVSTFCFKSAKIIAGVNADNFNTLVKVLNDIKPDVVINCIGIIKQPTESNDILSLFKLNAVFPQMLAKHCDENNINMIHFSTDCVFGGERGNCSINDIPDCNELYGVSKLLGEATRPGCLTIRTSIIGRELRGRVSLLEWFLSQKGSQVKGFVNAQYNGFTTNAITDIIAELLMKKTQLEGVWHVSSEPINKYELLQIINNVYNLGITLIQDIHYVCDRRLDSSHFRNVTNFKPLTWEKMIHLMEADPTPY